MTASIPKQDPNTKRAKKKRMLFVRTKRIMKIVQVIPFFKLQNNT